MRRQVPAATNRNLRSQRSVPNKCHIMSLILADSAHSASVTAATLRRPPPDRHAPRAPVYTAGCRNATAAPPLAQRRRPEVAPRGASWPTRPKVGGGRGRGGGVYEQPCGRARST